MCGDVRWVRAQRVALLALSLSRKRVKLLSGERRLYFIATGICIFWMEKNIFLKISQALHSGLSTLESNKCGGLAI